MAENLVMDPLQAFVAFEDDERRAIERLLHDGAQQLLVALAVNVQLARRLVDDDPAAAVRLLEHVQTDVGLALDEVRAAAGRIHPPLLDSQGLVAALRMAAAATPIPTHIDGSVEPELSSERAVTVYRCFVAALDAAVGERPQATVRIMTVEDAVELEVALTSASFDREALAPLTGRVQAFGGMLEALPQRVVVRMPFRS